MKSSQLKSFWVLDKKRERLTKIFKQYPEIKSAQVFGADKNSEEVGLDILISYSRGTSLFSLSGLQYDIEQLFDGLHVNLISQRRYRANAARAKSKMAWLYQQENC
ncbi:MAG: hypothetical protein Q4G44_05135 [Alcaligenaceae bacterium]|nr:hypothetical protein [Alcaligenaceae bacterium]